MSNNLSHSQNTKFDFLLIENEINELEKILFEKKINEAAEFKKWQNDFKLIYGSKNTGIQLYITIALIYFIGHYFISKYAFKSTELAYNDRNFISNIKELQYEIEELKKL